MNLDAPEARVLLKSKPFKAVLIGNSADDFAQASVPIALAFLVLQNGHSVTALGLTLGLRSIVSLLFMLLGGWLGDRFSRPLVLCGANGTAGGFLLFFALFYQAEQISLAAITTMAVVSGAFGALAAPAGNSLVPLVVDKTLIGSANSFVRLGINIAAVGGAATAGFAASLFDAQVSLGISGAFYVLAALAYLPLLRQLSGSRYQVDPLISPMKDGWRIFWGTSWIYITVLVFSLVNAVYQGAFLVLGPAIANDTYGPAGWGVIIAAQVIGFIVGAALSLRFNKKRHLWIGYLSATMMALPLVGLGLSVPLATLVALAFLAGLGAEQLAVAWGTQIQTLVPTKNLSSVVAFDLIGSAMLQPVAQISAGPLAEQVGTQPLLVASSVFVVVILVVAGATPAVRKPKKASSPS